MKLGEALSLKAKKTSDLATAQRNAALDLLVVKDNTGKAVDATIAASTESRIPTYLSLLDELTSLSVRINLTNATTRVTFDGTEWTLAGLLAERARCMALTNFYRGLSDTVSKYPVVNPEHDIRHRLYSDPIKVAEARKNDYDLDAAVATAVAETTTRSPVISYKDASDKAGQFGARARSIDTFIQETNWTTELL